MNEQLPMYQTGDLVKKYRHGENMAGIVLEGISFHMVKVMWETGTASLEVDDDLELIVTAKERRRYLIEGNNRDE